MSHWSQQYVGLQYEPGVFDCGSLVERVQREVFGRAIKAPTGRDYLEAKSLTEKFQAMTQQIDRLKDEYSVPTQDPVDGDAVLLIARGTPKHIGLLCVIGGEKWVLHATSTHKQVVLQRLRDLEIRGLKLEGYYKWK